MAALEVPGEEQQSDDTTVPCGLPSLVGDAVWASRRMTGTGQRATECRFGNRNGGAVPNVLSPIVKKIMSDRGREVIVLACECLRPMNLERLGHLAWLTHTLASPGDRSKGGHLSARAPKFRQGGYSSPSLGSC